MLERFAAYQFTVQQYDFLSYSRMQQPNAQLKPVLYEVREQPTHLAFLKTLGHRAPWSVRTTLQSITAYKNSQRGIYQAPRGFAASLQNKSSAVAEMGDRGHKRQRPKRGGVLCLFRGALGTRLIQCGLRRCLLPYQVASSFIQPFGHNSVGCHSPHMNISTNQAYYLVVKIHTVTVRSDDARYLLN